MYTDQTWDNIKSYNDPFYLLQINSDTLRTIIT